MIPHDMICKGFFTDTRIVIMVLYRASYVLVVVVHLLI